MATNLRLLLPLCLAVGCSDDDNQPCDPAANTGCDTGNVCEVVAAAEPACFAPVEIHGRVLDLGTDASIAGARVVGLDVNGGAATGVAVSAADGSYKLRVPAQRDADGLPAAFPVSLRADAAGYQTFPSGLRVALPLDTGTAVLGDAGYVVQSALTDVGLLALAGAGTGELHGKVAVPDDHVGVLVVAETTQGTGNAGFSAIAAVDGDYKIYNLPAGHYAVTGYARGHVYARTEVDVAGSTKLDLALTAETAGSLSGSVSIVNAPGGSMTSVVVFVESTFDPITGRGVQPPGLRAPNGGIAPNVTGAFAIDGVPPGRYVVVAAFENDNLVRDPDRCISGTDDVHVEVAAGAATPVAQAFKVTEALAIMSPGAQAAELVTAAPTLRWNDDSSEDNYLVECFDAFGQRVWMTDVAGTSGKDPSVAYGGPMAPGMYYQWRVTSQKNQCNLARTEDLRGVFYIP